MEITNRYLGRFNAARAACPPPNFINSPSVQLRTTPYKSENSEKSEKSVQIRRKERFFNRKKLLKNCISLYFVLY